MRAISNIISDSESSELTEVKENFSDAMRLPERFRAINQLILRDLNSRKSLLQDSYYKYTKEQVKKFVNNPEQYVNELRDTVDYLYGASSHFRRLIQYFSILSDLFYIVSPFKIDTASVNQNSLKRNYSKVLNLLASMDLKNQLEKILIVCLRDDTFYGTIREGADSTLIQQLPAKYCKISMIEDNVFNVSFDFNYFTLYPERLPFYPEEFSAKYLLYHGDSARNIRGNSNLRWQTLDAPNSFAIKCNKDMPYYDMPPFAGIIRELYDLEDYKQLKKDKENIDNYALLVMHLGMDDDGNWLMDYNKAVDFWHNLDGVLPDEIGSVLSPMPIDKISFERTHTGETDAVADAEQNLFTAAGVSSLLFNNVKASSAALLLSIKADQALTFSIVKSIETMLNRFINRHNFGKNFRVTFLDCSPFNRNELGDQYLKACTYGFPFLSMYAASQGMLQADVDYMNYLEDTILDLHNRLKPLQSSATLSSETATDGGGRPELPAGQLTDSGDITRDRGEE